MKKVINRGYTLEVISWENDGDNYNTRFKTVDTLEEASKLYKICSEVFQSCHNSNYGVGNSMCGEEYYKLVTYVEKNPDMFPDLKGEDLEEYTLGDYFKDIAYELMGNSEYYNFRVCESVEVRIINN